MNNNNSSRKYPRYSLGILLLLIALNAFAGGYYGLAGAETVPTEWLKGSPFQSYHVPGFFLFVVVGGSAAVAAVAVFRAHRLARMAAFICSIIILLWLSVQLAIIGYVSWMQPAAAMSAVLVGFLALQLPKYEH